MKRILLTGLSIVIFLYSCNKKENVREISLIGENTATIAAISKIKGEYETNNKLKISTFPYEFATLSEKSNADLASGAGRYDVIMQYNFALSSYVRNNYVYTIDELKKGLPDTLFSFEEDIFPNIWKEVGYYYDINKNDESSIKIGYPFASNTMLLVYNKEMFENPSNQTAFKKKYGQTLEIPTSWEQYSKIAEFFTKKDKSTYGVCMQGASNGELYYEFVNYLFSIGTGVLDKTSGWGGNEKTNVIIDNEENLKALEYYLSLQSFNKGDYFNVDQPLQTKLFKEGNVAMAIMWSDLIYPQIYKSNGKTDNRFGYAPIPGNKSFIGGGAYYINKKSKNPQEAFRFVLWLLNKTNQVEMAKIGLCSPRKSVYNDPDVQKLPYTKALNTSLNRGVYMMEAGPDADMISQIITKNVQLAWRNKINQKEGLNAQSALTKMGTEISDARKEIFNNIK